MTNEQKLFYNARPITEALRRVESEPELRKKLLESIRQDMQIEKEQDGSYYLEVKLRDGASPNVQDWERWGFASQEDALGYSRRHTRHIFHAFTDILSEIEAGSGTVAIHEAMQRIGFSLFGGWVHSQIAQESAE
jgi:hypothetical protein